MYDALGMRCPGFQTLTGSATLLVSPPAHRSITNVDGPPNFLWHIRGEKRVHIYPQGDRRLVSQEIMEDVFASVADEEMHYERAWDSFAVVYLANRFFRRPGIFHFVRSTSADRGRGQRSTLTGCAGSWGWIGVRRRSTTGPR